MKEYNFKINGNDYSVSITKVEESNAEVTVNGAVFNVELEKDDITPKIAPVAHITPDPQIVAAAATTPRPVVARPSVVVNSAIAVKSPLPGAILAISVSVGDSVKVGQRLLVLEAMKMENNIDSDREGVVTSINIGKGDLVLEGDLLLTIE